MDFGEHAPSRWDSGKTLTSPEMAKTFDQVTKLITQISFPIENFSVLVGFLVSVTAKFCQRHESFR